MVKRNKPEKKEPTKYQGANKYMIQKGPVTVDFDETKSCSLWIDGKMFRIPKTLLKIIAEPAP